MSAPRRDGLVDDFLDFGRELLLASRGWNRTTFLENRMQQRVAERLLELLGEVATKLGEEAPDVDVDWRGWRGLRLVLAHMYERVDPPRLWRHVTSDVPKAVAALELWVADHEASA